MVLDDFPQVAQRSCTEGSVDTDVFDFRKRLQQRRKLGAPGAQPKQVGPMFGVGSNTVLPRHDAERWAARIEVWIFARNRRPLKRG